MNIYCISGLGVDKRAFKYLTTNHKLIHIDWLNPAKNESLSSYCARLSKQINTNEPFILLGLSFGGVVACEIAKTLKPEKVILLSSITNKKHLPLIFKVVGLTGIHKIIPAAWMSPPMVIAYWFFGVKKSDNKQLLKEIIRDTDKVFLKWAIGILLSNEKIAIPKNLIRVHGANDKLLPLRNTDNIITIDKGGHFMVVEQAYEVSNELNKLF